MALGTRDLVIIEGDVFKVTAPRARNVGLPIGTMAPVDKVIEDDEGRKYELKGHKGFYLTPPELELIAYFR